MAVQGRKDDSYPFLIKINSPKSQAMAEAERSFVKTLDGGCSSPIAACALIERDRLKLRGLYFEEKSGRWVVGSLEGSVQGPAELGRSLALRLKSEIEQEKV